MKIFSNASHDPASVIRSIYALKLAGGGELKLEAGSRLLATTPPDFWNYSIKVVLQWQPYVCGVGYYEGVPPGKDITGFCRKSDAPWLSVDSYWKFIGRPIAVFLDSESLDYAMWEWVYESFGAKLFLVGDSETVSNFRFRGIPYVWTNGMHELARAIAGAGVVVGRSESIGMTLAEGLAKPVLYVGEESVSAPGNDFSTVMAAVRKL